MTPNDPQQHVTRILARAQAGDPGAESELLPLVYAELKGLARAVFKNQDGSHTLQPTALVHEAFIKMVGKLDGIEGKRHFMLIAGRAMRQILTDHARARRSNKRGGDYQRITFHPDITPQDSQSSPIDLLTINDSLERLQSVHPRHAQILELRLFSGLTVQEIAETLQISPRTVDTGWALGKAWLRKDLAEE